MYNIYNRFKKDVGKNLFPSLYRRPMFEFICKHNNKMDLIGVEMGVSIGYNAKNILTRIPIKKLYLVDPYGTYTQYGHTYYRQDEELNKAKHRLRHFKNKIEFIKKKSPPVRNNNVVINVRNQYNELLPFYVIPIGGVPKYDYNIAVKRTERDQ